MAVNFKIVSRDIFRHTSALAFLATPNGASALDVLNHADVQLVSNINKDPKKDPSLKADLANIEVFGKSVANFQVQIVQKTADLLDKAIMNCDQKGYPPKSKDFIQCINARLKTDEIMDASRTSE